MRFVLFLLALLAAAAVPAWFYLDSRVGVAIESATTRALATEVEVGRVLPVWEGGPALAIRDLRIANPEPFGGAAVAAVDSIRLVPAGWSLDDGLRTVALSGVELQLEKRRDAINFVRLFAAIDRVARQAGAGADGFAIERIELRSGRLVSRLGPRYGRAGLVERGLGPAVFRSDDDDVVVHSAAQWTARIADGVLQYAIAASRDGLPAEFVGTLDRELGDRPAALRRIAAEE